MLIEVEIPEKLKSISRVIVEYEGADNIQYMANIISFCEVFEQVEPSRTALPSPSGEDEYKDRRNTCDWITKVVAQGLNQFDRSHFELLKFPDAELVSEEAKNRYHNDAKFNAKVKSLTARLMEVFELSLQINYSLSDEIATLRAQLAEQPSASVEPGRTLISIKGTDLSTLGIDWWHEDGSSTPAEWLILDASNVVEREKATNKEWLEKTNFIQKMMDQGKLSGKYLGWHRADIMRALIEDKWK